MKQPLTRIRVGQVPPGWHSIRIMDLDKGDFLDHVVEVDTIDGWLFRYCVDRKGNFIFDEKTHCFRTERLTGRFAILGIRQRS